MARSTEDEEREWRIQNEIVVDAYGPEEQAIGWYTYLDDTMQFPFLARCMAERVTSPLRIGDEVEIVGMAPLDACDHEMIVLTPWERRTLGIPLSQIAAIVADDETEQAIGDWHYWAGAGNVL